MSLKSQISDLALYCNAQILKKNFPIFGALPLDPARSSARDPRFLSRYLIRRPIPLNFRL